MKRTRRFLAACLAAWLTFTLAGCNRPGGTGGGQKDAPAEEAGSDDFQKNLHQTDEVFFLETEEGYYFSWGSLFYIEKASGKTTRVCAKPDCDHMARTATPGSGRTISSPGTARRSTTWGCRRIPKRCGL